MKNIESEQIVLSTVLYNERQFEKISFLEEEDFTVPEHKAIFKKMLDCFSKGLSPFVFHMGEHKDYCMKMKENEIFGVSVLEHACYLRDLRNKRTIVKRFKKNIEDCESGQPISAEDIAEESLSFLNTIYNHKTEEVEVMQEIENSFKRKDEPILNACGLRDVDNKLNGFEAGRFYVIAARPAMGKSALACSMSLGFIKNKRRVGFISLEMTKNELLKRMISISTEIPYWNLKTGNLEPYQFDKAMKHRKEFENDRMMTENSCEQHISSVLACMSRMVSRNKVDILFIDHMSLIDGSNKKESVANQMREVSKLLKVYSKRLNVPIIALCQLNRGLENRANKRPIASDLRDSGTIEQDADCIMFLHRQSVYDLRNRDYETTEDSEELAKSIDSTHAELIFDKVRDGETGTVDLRFEGSKMKFGDRHEIK